MCNKKQIFVFLLRIVIVFSLYKVTYNKNIYFSLYKRVRINIYLIYEKVYFLLYIVSYNKKYTFSYIRRYIMTNKYCYYIREYIITTTIFVIHESIFYHTI